MSVAIPAASRSWIGKAHLIEASLTATYVPPSAFRNDGTWHETTHVAETTAASAAPRDQEQEQQDWVVLHNGTPASCVQLGLFNLFADRGPIDLVISGPNHGRNASTIYNLSSGTVGGALEAATCGKRGIAISFGSKDEQPLEIIHAASRQAVKLVDHLIDNWDARVELYNLNVPMRVDVEEQPILYTRTLPYYWARGYLYAEVDDGSAAPVVNGSHHQLTNGVGANGVATTPKTNGVAGETSQLKTRNFKWSAKLDDMKKALQASPEGTDAHTVLNGMTRYVPPPVLPYPGYPGYPALLYPSFHTAQLTPPSVTPLCANFMHVPGLDGPIVLQK